MRFSRMLAVAMVGSFSLVLLAGTGAMADTAAYFVPPEEIEQILSSAKLVADRQYGFAPMTVTLSGMLQSREGDLFPIGGHREVLLVVESPFLHLSSVTGSRHIGTDFRFEATAPGPVGSAAYVSTVELSRPGRYVFRIQVVDDEGRILESNEVTVKAM